MPASNRTRASLPPVVASVADVQQVTPPVILRAKSARNAGIVGAVFGLFVVAVFVVAVRLAYHPPVQSGAAARPSTKTAASIELPASSLLATDKPRSPGVAGAPMANAQQEQAKRGVLAVPRPAQPAALPAEAPTPGARPVEIHPAAAPAANNHPNSAAAGSSPTAPDDTPPSMVPVIPQGPPPEVDPLVKAVLEANDPAHK